jgi:hypothetical protein
MVAIARGSWLGSPADDRRALPGPGPWWSEIGGPMRCIRDEQASPSSYIEQNGAGPAARRPRLQYGILLTIRPDMQRSCQSAEVKRIFLGDVAL